MERRIDDQRPSAPLDWEAKHAAMERAGELPLERRVAERRAGPPALVTVMAETVARLEKKVLDAENLLHRAKSAIELSDAQRWSGLTLDISRALASQPAAPVQPASSEQGTPSAHWRAKGEADHHDSRYDCERAALCMGDLTDDELANEAFLNYDRRPSFDDLVAGKGIMPIAWMTAVKDRIRWLSRSLEKALAAPPVQQPGDVRDELPITRSTYGSAEECEKEHARRQALATTRPSAALTASRIDELSIKHRDDYGNIDPQAFSRAILAASSGAVAVPEGFVLVPIKDTPAMNEAYNNIVTSGFGGSPAHSSHVWEAMISAAPATPAQGQTK